MAERKMKTDKTPICKCGSKEAGLILIEEDQYQCGTCIRKIYAILSTWPRMLDDMQSILDRMTTGNLAHHKGNLSAAIQGAKWELTKRVTSVMVAQRSLTPSSRGSNPR